ncbi:hypothetical protein Hdeb2414_s0008g00277721 [Helianthus debilis subsp. tardiflorus]
MWESYQIRKKNADVCVCAGERKGENISKNLNPKFSKLKRQIIVNLMYEL